MRGKILITAFGAALLFAASALIKGDGPVNDNIEKCRSACGLPADDAELRNLLTPEQYRIIRENGTEAPFQNAYWDNKKEGLYLDAVSGDPLFSSTDKFDSGTGWPSFTAPVDPDAVVYRRDKSHGMTRIEVRSARADSHLGHLFADGPAPAGLRYCINSASLRFVESSELKNAGLDEYLRLFTSEARVAVEKRRLEKIMFGAGCFWGVEAYFKKVPGVRSTQAGYSGGTTENPDYKRVCAGDTMHAEVVLIEYDPRIVSFNTMLGHFFKIHDPTSLNRQAGDVGTQYRSAIFYYDERQKTAAEEYIALLEKSGRHCRKIVTELKAAARFYDAEEYHQDYLDKNPGGYCHIHIED